MSTRRRRGPGRGQRRAGRPVALAEPPPTGTGSPAGEAPQTGSAARLAGLGIAARLAELGIAARLVELGIQIGGCLVAIWASLVLAVLGVYLTPLRVGGTPVPVSLVIAVAGNAGLVWFAWTVTGRRLAAMLPGVAWLLVAVLSAGSTREGDVPLAGNSWVALAFLLTGTLTVAVAGYRLVVTTPIRPPDPPDPPGRGDPPRP